MPYLFFSYQIHTMWRASRQPLLLPCYRYTFIKQTRSKRLLQSFRRQFNIKQEQHGHVHAQDLASMLEISSIYYQVNRVNKHNV